MPRDEHAQSAAGAGGNCRRARIVHLSGDFPDPIEPHKTEVIRRLIDLTADSFDHQVISLNRKSPNISGFARETLRRPAAPRLSIEEAPFDYGSAVTYVAPPRGLYHETMLRQLGEWLARKLAASPPDLIVGHKLTIEGIAVARAAAVLGIPYAIMLQGRTETRILPARPDLARSFRAVLAGASTVFALTPWVIQRVEQYLGIELTGAVLVPAPTELDEPLPPRVDSTGLVSMFHLRHHRVKNLSNLVAAHRLMTKSGLRVPLRVFGGGSAENLARCRQLARRDPLAAFPGNADRPSVRQALNSATAFVMPSREESFGLVFVEALFAGTPIIYPAGRSVDGYFDGLPFALRVNPNSPRDIAAAMRRAVEDEQSLKRALREWQQGPDLARFRRASIADTFRSGLFKALSGQPQ